MQDKLQKLLTVCQAGIFITVNEHRNYYMSVSEHLKGYSHEDFIQDIPIHVLQGMQERDSIVSITLIWMKHLRSA